MSVRTLQSYGGSGGGAVRLHQDPERARNIHVTVLNSTAATHAVFFGRSRRELAGTPTGIGISGFAIVAPPNTVVNQTVNGVSYTSFILQGWTGELWAASDADGVVAVDSFDAAFPEA